MALFVRKDFLELTSKDCDDGIEVDVDVDGYCNTQHQSAEILKNESKLDLKQQTVAENDCVRSHSGDRSNISENDAIEAMIAELSTTHIATEDFRLIRSCVYPKNVDERSHEQKIFDEACFHLSRYMRLDDDHYDADNNVIKVPVKRIFELTYKFTSDINEFR